MFVGLGIIIPSEISKGCDIFNIPIFKKNCIPFNSQSGSSLFALGSWLLALRSSILALRSSLFALGSSLFALGSWLSALRSWLFGQQFLFWQSGFWQIKCKYLVTLCQDIWHRANILWHRYLPWQIAAFALTLSEYLVNLCAYFYFLDTLDVS